MEKFDENYWYQHICYSMGKADTPPIGDDGNFIWSQNNMNRILEGKPPFGLKGHKLVAGYMIFISEYHPEKLDQSLNIMIDYIEDIQKKEKRPLKKVHAHLLSLLSDTN